MRCSELIREANGSWSALTYKLEVSPNGMGRGEPIKLQNVSLDDASVFLQRAGIRYDEIDYALVELTKNEHNVANFGIQGSFISSRFEGILH